VDFWEAENTWYWNAPVSRLSKAIAQWEIYKSIIELPGEIAEFGTYKAASLIRLATFREIAESAHSRRIVAFDAFGRFPSAGEGSSQDAASFVERFEAEGGDGLSEDEVGSILQVKGFANIDLVGGDIFETLPNHLERHPELRLALVHVDVDLHAVTRLVLDLTAPLLVQEGLFMLDDYGKVAGATQAVDEFLLDNPAFAISKTGLSYAPSVLRRGGGGRGQGHLR
jgi:hypothetical protein